MLNSLFIKEFDWIKEPDEYFDIEQVINGVKIIIFLVFGRLF